MVGKMARSFMVEPTSKCWLDTTPPGVRASLLEGAIDLEQVHAYQLSYFLNHPPLQAPVGNEHVFYPFTPDAPF